MFLCMMVLTFWIEGRKGAASSAAEWYRFPRAGPPSGYGLVAKAALDSATRCACRIASSWPDAAGHLVY